MLKITKTPVFAGLFAALLILTGCASVNRVPGWVLDNNAAWNPSKYITAVGEGPTMQQAQLDATQALARILKQKVQSETTANTHMTDDMTEVQITKSLDQLVQVTTDINVTGVRIQENYCHTDKNGNTTWYALALLDRSVTGSWYEEQVIQNSAQAYSLQAASQEAELNHQGLTAIKLMRQAEATAHLADEQITILSVINQKKYENALPAWQPAKQVSNMRVQLEKSQVFGVSIANDYDERVTKAIQSIFAAENLDCTTDLATATAGTLTGELTITPFDATTTTSNKYVRYTLTASLVDGNGIEQLPVTITGREAHLTTEEATQRAIRTVETELKTQLASLLEAALQ